MVSLPYSDDMPTNLLEIPTIQKTPKPHRKPGPLRNASELGAESQVVMMYGKEA